MPACPLLPGERGNESSLAVPRLRQSRGRQEVSLAPESSRRAKMSAPGSGNNRPLPPQTNGPPVLSLSPKSREAKWGQPFPRHKETVLMRLISVSNRCSPNVRRILCQLSWHFI